MSRTVKEPEERRKDILKAALRLFKEKGYEKTVVSDIVSWYSSRYILYLL